jgi:hypothetical protein
MSSKLEITGKETAAAYLFMVPLGNVIGLTEEKPRIFSVTIFGL